MKSAINNKSSQSLKGLVCLLALTGLYSTCLQAHEKNFGYLHDRNGELILNSLGECIRTSSWTAETATPQCEGVEETAEVVEEVMVADADQDGVADASDNCPATPTGAVVDAVGCELDSDRDGVVDSADNCPGTVFGETVDGSGCKVVVAASVAAVAVAPKDSDNDGIVDSKDECPDSAAGVVVDAAGCELKQTTVLEGVNFVSGSDEITAESGSALDKVAETLRNNEDLKVEIAGYTDDRGAADFNQALSQKRAESVKAYLESAGIAADRMTAKGYGEFDPISDNSTARGRALNRRVELHVVE